VQTLGPYALLSLQPVWLKYLTQFATEPLRAAFRNDKSCCSPPCRTTKTWVLGAAAACRISAAVGSIAGCSWMAELLIFSVHVDRCAGSSGIAKSGA
jgi:hypothetical protein